MIYPTIIVLIFGSLVQTICKGQTYKEYETKPIDNKNDKYYFSSEKVNYYDALQMCHEKDMQLVSIETKRKNREIFQMLNDTDQIYWTSGHKLSEDSYWSWLKGESIEFKNWKPNYNENFYKGYDQYCIAASTIGNDLLWKLQSCGINHPFICEKLSEGVKYPKCNDVNNEELVHGKTMAFKKYFIGKEIVTYSKALQICKSMCMKLVSIEHREKNQDLFEAFVAANETEIFWSSGHFKPHNNWQWGNGETAKFFSWNKQEPNNARGNEYCIEVLKNDEKIIWNDQPCEDRRMYVCESIEHGDFNNWNSIY